MTPFKANAVDVLVQVRQRRNSVEHHWELDDNPCGLLSLAIRELK
jgi:hypothetical protein